VFLQKKSKENTSFLAPISLLPYEDSICPLDPIYFSAM
jgi:hypothetical protein